MALTKLNYTGQGVVPIAQIPTMTHAKMPTGSVLQTLYARGSSGHSNGVEESWIDVVSLAITPSSTSSKILCQLSCTGYGSGTGLLSVQGRIYNSTSSTSVEHAEHIFYRDGSGLLKGSGSFLQSLDSPNSTSAQTYKGQAFIVSASTQSLYWENSNGNEWTLSLQEIAG